MSATATLRKRSAGDRIHSPAREIQHVDYKNVEVLGWRVTHSLPVETTHARWELCCTTCGITRATQAHVIREALEGSGPERRRLTACKHPEIEISAAACRDQFGIAREEFLTVVAVLSHEKVRGSGVLRLDVEKMRDASVSTAELVKKGWLVATGMPAVLTSTAKARRELWVG